MVFLEMPLVSESSPANLHHLLELYLGARPDVEDQVRFTSNQRLVW